MVALQPSGPTADPGIFVSRDNVKPTELVLRQGRHQSNWNWYAAPLERKADGHNKSTGYAGWPEAPEI